MYTLDTNAIIYYTTGDERALKLIDGIFASGAPLFISTVSEIELFAFSRLSESEAGRIEYFLQAVSIIPLDSRIARRAALLRSLYRTKTLDSAIAATALSTSSKLVTRNARDFKNIPNLEIVQV